MADVTTIPQSRVEDILVATINSEPYNEPPQSRIENLLLQLKDVIEGGGGGGTTNYNLLENLPKINGVTIKGDETGEHYNLVDQDADLTNEQMAELLSLLG